MCKSLFILAMMLQSLASMAQSESGLLLEAEAEKKLSKKFSVALEADMRTRNDFKTMDRWSIGVGGEYKPESTSSSVPATPSSTPTSARASHITQAEATTTGDLPIGECATASTYPLQERISSATTCASPCASAGNTPTAPRKLSDDGTSTTHGGRQGAFIQGQGTAALTPASGIR